MISIKKLYKLYYTILLVLGIIFGFAVYENYSEKEELKGVILHSYAYIIQNAIYKFVKVENRHNVITQNSLKEFMQNLEVDYDDFKVQFLFEDEKNNLTKDELSILNRLDRLKNNNFYERFGFFNRVYYIALKNKSLKEKYNNLFIKNSGDIIGIIRFLEDSKKDNIAGDLEENFYITEFLFITIWILLAILGFFLLKILKKYFDVIEEKNKFKIEREVAEKNEKLKSEFLANMSHEIRTPLNAMFGFIKLLEEKNLDKESKNYLNIIEKSGENLLGIINDILDFSKIESGKISMEKAVFNLKDEIQLEYQLFASKANEKEIKLYLNENNIDLWVISDSMRIKQVISNLLSNAIKFTPKNKNIYFNISYDIENEELYVEVKDEGIGIPKEKILSIFNAFTQVDNSTTRKYGGTGLGLSISYKLVKLLGGELKVESEEGKGTKFYFNIPLKKSEKIIKKVNKKISDEKFNYHILVAEDNKANQMFMGVILKKLGLTFDIANDGIEVVEKYKLNYTKYKMILMDENMPNMTGSEATIKIREFEKEHNLKNIFIVSLTANALTGDKERFLEVGMDKYLSKPLDIEKLKNVLREI